MPRLIWKYARGFSSNAAGQILGVITNLVFARSMGPSTFGLLGVILSFILLPSALVDLGISAATPKFIAVSLGQGQYDRIRSIVRKSALVMAVPWISLALGLYLLAPQISHWMNMPKLENCLQMLAVFVPAIYLHNIGTAWLKGLGKVELQISLQSFVLNSLICLLGLGLWFTTNDLVWVSFAYGLSYLLSGLWGAFQAAKIIRRLPRQADKATFTIRELLHEAIPLNIASLGGRLFRRGDILVVGAMLGENAAGLYRAGYVIASGIKMLVSPFNNFALYRMGKMVGEGDREGVFNHYHGTMLLSLSVVMPFYVFALVHAGQMLAFLYGHEYAMGATILQVLTVGFCIFVCVGPMGALFNVLGKNWIRMWIVLALGCLNIGLNVILIYVFGLDGAAWGTAISFVALFMTLQIYLGMTDRAYHMDSSYPKLLFGGLTAAFLIVVLTVEEGLIRLGLTVFLSLVLFGLGLLMTYRFYRGRLEGEAWPAEEHV